MAGFESWIVNELAPPWLRGPNAGSIMGAIGARFDALTARGREAILARHPGVGPLDALGYIGSDRQIERGIAESDASYQSRLTQARSLWEMAGSHTAIHRALATAGYTNAVIVNQLGVGSTWNATTQAATFFDCCTLPSTGKRGWYFDDSATSWSRFAIVFNGDPGNLRNETEFESLRSLVGKWKSSKAVFVGASVLTAGQTWGYAVQTWAQRGESTWGASTAYWIPGEAFEPSSVSDVLDWYDADSITGADGATVEEWAPIVGAHALAGYGTTKPTLGLAAVNTHSAVDFAGSGWLRSEAFADRTGPIDVLLVAKVTGALGSIYVMCNGIASDKELGICRTAANKSQIRNASDVPTTADMPTGWHLFHARFEGGSRSHLWIDESHPLENVNPGAAPTLSGITLGAWHNDDFPLVGQIAEAVFVDPLSGSDWTAVREHLRTKYRTP